MNRAILTIASTIFLILASAQSVYACGDFSDLMSVLIPDKVAIVLTHSEVLKLAREKGHIRHLAQDGSKVRIGTSLSEEIVTKVSFGHVGKPKFKNYSWPLDGEWLVRLEDYPNLVKFLLTEAFAKKANELSNNGEILTGLRISQDSQPIAVFSNKCIMGKYDANGNFVSLEEK